jgi:hypothetical protein
MLNSISFSQCRYINYKYINPLNRVLLEKLIVDQLVIRFRFVFTRSLYLFWNKLIQSALTQSISLRSILMLFSHLQLRLPSGLLPSAFPTEMQSNILILYVRTVCMEWCITHIHVNPPIFRSLFLHPQPEEVPMHVETLLLLKRTWAWLYSWGATLTVLHYDRSTRGKTLSMLTCKRLCGSGSLSGWGRGANLTIPPLRSVGSHFTGWTILGNNRVQCIFIT